AVVLAEVELEPEVQRTQQPALREHTRAPQLRTTIVDRPHGALDCRVLGTVGGIDLRADTDLEAKHSVAHVPARDVAQCGANPTPSCTGRLTSQRRGLFSLEFRSCGLQLADLLSQRASLLELSR